MNIFSRLFKKRISQTLSFEVEARLAALTPDERAAALVMAVNYCVDLRNNVPGEGTLMSMKLLNPRDLSAAECRGLYFALEGQSTRLKSLKVSTTDYQRYCSNYGIQYADEYQNHMEVAWSVGSLGLDILMARLSDIVQHREARVNEDHESPSPYSHIGSLLREALPHIKVETEKRAQFIRQGRPDNPWSEETEEFVRCAASNIGMLYPHS